MIKVSKNTIRKRIKRGWSLKKAQETAPIACKLNLTGLIFGRLTVIKEVEKKKGEYCWECLCSCGNTKVVSTLNLRRGHTNSCGCLRNTRGSKSQHPLYGVWTCILERCLDFRNPAYKNYGGRGISICDEWLKDYLAFYQWAIDHGYQKGLTIDRRDNNGNYTPINCHWTNRKVQCRNKRNNCIIPFQGKQMCLVDVAKFVSVNINTMYNRFRRGLSVEEIVNPIKRKNQFG